MSTWYVNPKTKEIGCVVQVMKGRKIFVSTSNPSGSTKYAMNRHSDYDSSPITIPLDFIPVAKITFKVEVKPEIQTEVKTIVLQ